MLIKLSAWRRVHNHGRTWSVVAQLHIPSTRMQILRDTSPGLIRALFEDGPLSAHGLTRHVSLALRQLLTILDSGGMQDPGASLRLARQLAILNHVLIDDIDGLVEVTP